MAPATNLPKGAQQNRSRQAAPKNIVPAIPLPYLQKRKQQLAVREKAKAEAAKAEIVLGLERSSTPLTSEITLAAVESPPAAHTSEKVEVELEKTTLHPIELAEPARSATPIVEELVQETPNEEQEEHEEQADYVEETMDTQQGTEVSAPSEPPSSASRSTFQMPPSAPAFVPASHNPPNNSTDSVKLPPPNMFNGVQPMHNAHPSTGSLMFGGYPESNNSSPAPPLSAGNIPPYQFQQQHQVSRHGTHLSNGSHGQHISNGHSQMGSQPPPGFFYPRENMFMSQGGAADHYARRQMTSFRTPDGYSPSPTPGFENQRIPTYDPSTPHSFHGSQSSVPNEQEGGSAFYGQYPTAVISNGSNGHIDEVRLYQQPRQKPRAGAQHLAPAQGNFPVAPPPVRQAQPDNYEGISYYLQNQFADEEWADYVLELRYSDDRANPVRIPGHGLIFARSPALKSLMRAQAQESNGLSQKSLFIESDDRFLRSDAFCLAVSRLYAGPFLDPGAAALHSLPRSAGQSPLIAGTPAERFDLALGYAAAGHILEYPPVLHCGMEIASLLVNWDTIEKAIDFAIDGGLDSSWTYHTQPDQAIPPCTYGPIVNMLIYHIVTFLVQAFPPNFQLDPSVGEPKHNQRLPHVSEDRPAPNHRLSSIKFGEYPSEETRQESGTSMMSTLSKVLLNLPFHLLKRVLESSHLGNVDGWASNDLRQKAMYSVIEERERRRLKVLQSAHVPEPTKDRFNDNVRWQETVVSARGPEGTPTLARTWSESGLSPVSEN